MNTQLLFHSRNLNSKFNQIQKELKKMIYIEDQDKENMHPNILANKKKVQFSDKFKRYPDSSQLQSQSSLQVSLQVTASKQGESPRAQKPKTSKQNHNKTLEPQVSYFEIDELKNLSKQISLKDVSRISSQRSKQLTKQAKRPWTKSIMEPSKAELKLLEKIDYMLEKQTFKPVYSTISRNKKVGNFNTMISDAILTSQYQSQSNKSSTNDSKSNSPQPNNRTSTLSDLINLSKLSKLSNLSNKTLEKYLMCLERDNNMNEMDRNHKVSEFNLLDTDRQKDITFDKKPGHILHIEKVQSKQSQMVKKQIDEIYLMITCSQKIDRKITAGKTLEKVARIRKYIEQNISLQN